MFEMEGLITVHGNDSLVRARFEIDNVRDNEQ